MENKREYERALVDQDVPIEIHRVQFSGKSFGGKVLARDVSLGGMRVELYGDLVKENLIGVSDEIGFIMTLPNGNPFAVTGIIRHQKVLDDGYALGVLFVDLDEEATIELDNYVSLRRYMEKRTDAIPPDERVMA